MLFKVVLHIYYDFMWHYTVHNVFLPHAYCSSLNIPASFIFIKCLTEFSLFVSVIIHVNIVPLLYGKKMYTVLKKKKKAVLLVRLKKIYRCLSPHTFLSLDLFHSAVEESRCCCSCCGFPPANTAMCLFAVILFSLSFFIHL